MKSYTDLSQSKKLAEFLPLESADMWWSRCTITDFGDGVLKVSYAVEPCNISQFRNTKEDIPCWSLAALLELIPNYVINKADDKIYAKLYYGFKSSHDNLVDAAFELILELHELNEL